MLDIIRMLEIHLVSYISQLIRFARLCSHVDDFNTRNKCLAAKLLKQGYQYRKLRKAFSKFYRRHNELVSNSMSMIDFSDLFRKIKLRYKQTAKEPEPE